VDSRLADICRAIPATHDDAVVRSCSAAVAALVRILRAVRVAIGFYDEQIETLARQHPDFTICNSFPGVGPVLAPRLIAALGTQRDRYASASDLQAYSGIAPVVASSGKQQSHVWILVPPCIPGANALLQDGDVLGIGHPLIMT